MLIFIKLIDQRTLSFDVQSAVTVDEVKVLVEETEGVPPESQALIYAGK